MATPLTVQERFPRSDEQNVYLDTGITARFSEPVDPNTVTYINFTVNERDSYLPVEGVVTTEAYATPPSGVPIILEAIARFTPTENLKINTRYSVLASVGILDKDDGTPLEHDTVWYFTTCGVVTPTEGDDEDEEPTEPVGETVVPSGSTGPTSGAISFSVASTNPDNYGTNIPLNTQHIAITFNDVIPSGVDWYDYIQVTEKGVLG